MNTTSPKWFTIMEILVTISILAIAFAWIFVVLENSSWLIAQSKIKTQNINISREGIEIIHNIRDTNWTRRSAQKEECRLKIDPLADDDGICSNDAWMKSWRYTIIQETTSNNQEYFALQRLSGVDIKNIDDIVTIAENIQICNQGALLTNCDRDHSNTTLRIIQIKWLYEKNTNIAGGELLDCDNGEDVLCGWPNPKELVFCAHTYNIKEDITQTTLCSAITNFAK